MDQSEVAIDGVVFDAVGTLIHPVQAIEATYQEYGRRFGSRLTCGEIAGRFRHAFRAASWEPATNEHYRQAWRQIVTAVFHESTSAIDELFDPLWTYFGQPAAWSVGPRVAELLLALQARGKRLAIASNFDDRLLAICADFPELAPCEMILPATTLGAAKPSPLFFQAVSSRLRLPPERLLMIGDDAELDVAAARSAGWHAIRS